MLKPAQGGDPGSDGSLKRVHGGGRSGGTLLEHAQRDRDRNASENCGNSPGLVACCPGSKGGAQESQYQPAGRAPGPRAEPYELPAQAILFDSHEYSDGAQHSAPHFQIPAVVVAPRENRGAFCLEGRLDRLEPLIRSPPTLAPSGGHPRPRESDSDRPTPPRGEARLQATPQT